MMHVPAISANTTMAKNFLGRNVSRATRLAEEMVLGRNDSDSRQDGNIFYPLESRCLRGETSSKRKGFEGERLVL